MNKRRQKLQNWLEERTATAVHFDKLAETERQQLLVMILEKIRVRSFEKEMNADRDPRDENDFSQFDENTLDQSQNNL